MCTARPGWQTISFRQPKYKKTLFNVKVNLMDVLEINTEKRVDSKCIYCFSTIRYIFYIFRVFIDRACGTFGFHGTALGNS